jgi:hypothetical protein
MDTQHIEFELKKFFGDSEAQFLATLYKNDDWIIIKESAKIVSLNPVEENVKLVERDYSLSV